MTYKVSSGTLNLVSLTHLMYHVLSGPKNRPLILSQLSYSNVKLEVKFTVHPEAKIISKKWT